MEPDGAAGLCGLRTRRLCCGHRSEDAGQWWESRRGRTGWAGLGRAALSCVFEKIKKAGTSKSRPSVFAVLLLVELDDLNRHSPAPCGGSWLLTSCKVDSTGTMRSGIVDGVGGLRVVRVQADQLGRRRQLGAVDRSMSTGCGRRVGIHQLQIELLLCRIAGDGVEELRGLRLRVLDPSVWSPRYYANITCA